MSVVPPSGQAQVAGQQVVLFVDDEPEILAGYCDALRKEPYQILTSKSPALALDMLSRTRVDVVVSDEVMPRMCGSAFLERVHLAYPEIVRIMLTGEASLAASVRAINGGLYRFLGKPIQPEELSRVIRDALKIKSAADMPKRR